MKFIRLFILLFFILPRIVHAQKEWQLLKDKEEVQIYLRDIPGSGNKELRAISTFNCSLDALVSLLTDVESLPSYQYACMSSSVLKKHSPFEQSYYQTIYMPWPFTNRDGVFKQEVKVKSNKREVLVEAKCLPNLLPAKSDFIRVPQMHSKWQIKKINDSCLQVEFYIMVDPGGAVPPWLVNLFIDKGPFESILIMRKLVLKEPYRSSNLNWLRAKE